MIISRLELDEWDNKSMDTDVSENEIRKNIDKVNWSFISSRPNLSEKFMLDFEKQLNWNTISMIVPLSPQFANKMKHKVNWELMSSIPHLSEDFIRVNKKNVLWGHISLYQKLSATFIYEFKNYINWNNLLENNMYSKAERKKLIILYKQIKGGK